MWVDHFGNIQLKNTTSGYYCDLNVTKAGWLGAGRFETKAVVYNDKGEVTYVLHSFSSRIRKKTKKKNEKKF
jgi:hypothetical protein